MRWLLALGLGCAGCFGGSDADLSSIEVALVAASSIGHSASLTAAAMHDAVACVTVSQPCSASASYPCNGAASVTLGTACPLPLGGVGNGQVAVSGSWAASDMATLGMMFGIGVSDGNISVSEAIGVKVTSASTGHDTVAYSGQNVSVTSGATLAAQSSWTVDVDGKMTLDPSDDVYTVNGADQSASAGSGADVVQISLTQVVLDPSCRQNPIAGMGVIQHVGTSSLQEDVVTFHAACDGKVDVKGTLGGSRSQKLQLFSK